MRLAIVDNHGMFMEGFAYSLEQFPEVEKVFSFYPEEVKRIIECLENNLIHLFIIDINLDGMSGFVFAENIKNFAPEMPIAFVTGHGNQANFRTEAREFGAAGFFLKDPKPRQFLAQIIQAINGKKPGMMEEKRLPKLTLREKETLFFICKGYTNKELSEQLNVTLRQVERHKKNLMLKFEVENDKKLIRKAINLGYEIIN
ncbi:response regulator [Marinilactibacillus psychrotolerans]|uniref:Response regulator n=2 Tax=Marinilactibacillus psychrotolerans TaxID=191770 RepID=A0A5R9BW73_9LACT|nr:response regulator transcription factor [Marinilactibacillus psychrotolerans]TLQ04877.1 response regulator transcription factor [Marinilactibacillus psychrotolerans]SJN38407.1 DNA-binding response regulator [Marinilactibacillus psychrotolerans 42ea]